MDDKGQVYFASNEELSQEDQERYKEALAEEEARYLGVEWLRRIRDNLTPEQREHVAQRTARKAREQAEAEAHWGTGAEEA